MCFYRISLSELQALTGVDEHLALFGLHQIF